MAHHILVASSLQIRFPHYNGLQSPVYFPLLPMHRETIPSFPLHSLHKTDHLHIVCGLHLIVFYLSGDRAKYRGNPHLPCRYSAHHWSPQGEYQAYGSFLTVLYLQFFVQGSHDPAFLKKSSLFQNMKGISGLSFPPHQ